MSAPDVSSKKRLLITLGIMALIFVVLLGRIFYIQLIWGDELQEIALTQQTRDTELSAMRGSIIDSSGVVLAQSGTAYKILVLPPYIKSGERVRVATELAEILQVDYETVLARVSDDTKKQIELKRGVERSVVEQIDERRLGGGVSTAIDVKRYYPSGSLFSQLLGFTTVDGVGQAGLEQRYNSYLAGEDGRLITETDRKSNTLAYGVEEMIEPIDGYDLHLTANGVIQSFLEKALKEAVEVNNAKGAQGVILNCKTGAIVALSSQPDYDPNSPPRSNLELLAELSRNKVVADAYEPGSTFKVVTLAAALDSGAVSTSSTFDCPGYHVVNGERIRCWKSGGHGHQTLAQAAQNSCNRAFMEMALKMGVETLYNYIYAFGFGSSTGSGVPGESGGIVTHEKYVVDNTLARIGFGQSIAVTPVQLAAAVGAAVNGGNLMQPYIISKVVAQNGEVILENEPTVVRKVISESTSSQVRAILESVVAEGSGKNAYIPGYRVGGKTGTAQKYENGKIADGKLIASFVGFAPADNPEYVCLILVDEPQVGVIFGSTVAAPFVKGVLEETLRYYGYLPADLGARVSVPNVVGKAAGEAEEELEGKGLVAVYQAEDEVTVQIPAAGEIVAEGTPVLLYTSGTGVDPAGQEEEDLVRVPDVLGRNRLQAHDLLAEAGLEILIDPPDQWGKAIRQVPQAGERVPAGTEVLVEFSSAALGE